MDVRLSQISLFLFLLLHQSRAGNLASPWTRPGDGCGGPGTVCGYCDVKRQLETHNPQARGGVGESRAPQALPGLGILSSPSCYILVLCH